MKDTIEIVDRLMSHFGTILRYFAPGFSTLLVLAALITEARTFLLSGSSAVVVLGMILGPTIYGLHTSALVRPLWCFIVWLQKDKKDSVKNMMSELDEQRWLRRASSEEKIKSIQNELDKWGSMQNFLYCLSYILVIIPVAVKFLTSYSIQPNWWAFLAAGCFILICVLVSEHRMTSREFEFKEKYPNGKLKS